MDCRKLALFLLLQLYEELRVKALQRNTVYLLLYFAICCSKKQQHRFAKEIMFFMDIFHQRPEN